MRIVTNKPDLLEIEHRTWGLSISMFFVFSFLSWVIWMQTHDMSLFDFLVAYAVCTVFPVWVIMYFSETVRMALDRNTREVRYFRMSFRGVDRWSRPLDQFRGAVVETRRIRGRKTERLYFVFDVDGRIEKFSMTVNSLQFVDTTDERDAINAWFGVPLRSVFRSAR